MTQYSPISVFLGQNDQWVSYEDHLGWIEQTHKNCDFHEFESGHLFIKEPRWRQEILSAIMKALRVTTEMVV